MSAPVLFNGGPVPELASHRALHYGDGVFRTCLIYDSQVIDIEDQLQLLSADAARLGLAPADRSVVRAEAHRLAAGQGVAVLKILLLRAGQARGYGAEGATTDRMLCRYAAPAYPAAAWDPGVTVCRASLHLASQPALAGIKHLNRLEQVLASRDWPADAEEALLADADGQPVCGTRTNLFWVKGATLLTPPLDRCGVAGHMRAKVLALAPAVGVPVRVQRGSWDEVEAADEVFLTNSLIGIWPVARLAQRRWAAPGPVTRRLAERLAHPRWVRAGRAA
jgi:4-amino-4-deoxychorismate lyase